MVEFNMFTIVFIVIDILFFTNSIKAYRTGEVYGIINLNFLKITRRSEKPRLFWFETVLSSIIAILMFIGIFFIS